MSLLIEDFLDKVVGRVTVSNFQVEIQKAREHYTNLAGKPSEELSSFESRMNSFIEWFLFDYTHSTLNKQLIDFLIEDCDQEFNNEEERKLLHALRENMHAVYITKKIKNGIAKVQDVVSRKKYDVDQSRNPLTSGVDEIFETRVVETADGYFFTNTFCYHPPEALKFIKNTLKAYEPQSEEYNEFLLKLAKMSLFYENSRNIPVTSIYKQ